MRSLEKWEFWLLNASSTEVAEMVVLFAFALKLSEAMGIGISTCYRFGK